MNLVISVIFLQGVISTSLAVNGTPGSLVKTSKMKYRVVRGIASPTTNHGNSTATPEVDSQCIPGIVCQRNEKLEYVGALHDVDLNSKAVRVDVGKCSCPDTGFDIKTIKTPRCPKKHSCFPAVSHVERLHLRTGPKDVPVIKSCQCALTNQKCRLLSNKRVYYAGTEYETTVDHGLCLGKCGSKSCVASRNGSVAIQTPNGPKNLEVIRECSCKSSCYRATHYDLFPETFKNETNGDIVTTWKLVDVGRCVGTCSVVENCTKWTALHLCIRSRTEYSCFDSRHSQVPLQRADGKHASVTVIDDCTCQPSSLSSGAKSAHQATVEQLE
jgi:hypothetical protein